MIFAKPEYFKNQVG